MFAGLFENFDMQGLNSPLGQVGLQLIAAHGTPKSKGIPGLGQAVQRGTEWAEKQEEKQKAEQIQNRTTMLLRTQAPELANFVEEGILSPKDAFNALIAQQEAEKKAEREARNKRFMGVGGQVFDRQSQEWIAPPEGTGKFDQYGLPRSGSLSQKISILERQGLDPETAMAVASGRYESSVNPMNGDRVLIDKATQEIIPLQLQQPLSNPQASGSASLPEVAQGGGLYDMSDDATGVWSSLKAGSSNTLGQVPGSIGEMFTYDDAVQAQQEFRLFQRDLIRSLSLNPRFPVAEQQRIEQLIPRGPLTSPAALQTSLEALDRELARIAEQAQQGLSDPRTPVEQRQADAQTLRSVQAARQRLEIGGGSGGRADALREKYGLE